MKYSLITMSFILMMVLCLSGCARKAPSSASKESSTERSTETSTERSTERSTENFEYIPCNFYDESTFKDHIASAKLFSSSFKTIQGGIVPHHLLAGTFIASFFKTLAKENPEVIIVIGPNHKAQGKMNILTTRVAFSTPFGLLETDTSSVEQLLKNSFLGESKTVFEEDHTISALVPYIKYYMPQVKILPFELKNSLEISSCEGFSNTLSTLMKGKKTVMVASVDFSHYLPVSQADQNDEVSLSAIIHRNVSNLAILNNGYFDSPPSLITLLSHFQGTPDVVWHGNSAKLCNNLNAPETTSYFCMFFGDKE